MKILERFAAYRRIEWSPYAAVLVGIGAGLFYWLIDVLVDAFLFDDRTVMSQLLHPNSRELWIRLFALGTMVGAGVIVSLAAARRKRIERELAVARLHLEDSRIQSQYILDAVADGVSLQDRAYRVLYQNRAHRALLGDHIGRFCYEVYQQRPAVCSGCPVAQAFQDGENHTVVRSTVIGGERRHFEITASPLRDASGTIIAGIEAVREITERVRAEQSMRESEQNYRTIAEESRDVFYISTKAGRFLDISPAGAELFGYASKDELLRIDIGRDLYANPADRQRFSDVVEKAGHARDYEIQMKRRNGEKVWVLINSTVLRDDQGAVIGYRGVIRDITEHRKLEQQLLQSQKMEAVGLLAGGIAHDFNNILTVIMAYGNLLQSSLQDNEHLRNFADQVVEGAERAAGLTRSILAFSRKQVLKPQPVDLNGIIARVRNLLVRVIGEDIELKTILHGGAITVLADSIQIEQVLINLATNARDAMPAGGSILIETSVVHLDEEHARAYDLAGEGRFGTITFRDTGAGFDERTQARIFEPFFTTKEAGKGTGLGLSIVHGIIRQHNGHIMVESAPGEGTTFTIHLALAEAAHADASGETGAAPLRGRETILLAEDDRTVRDLMRGVLEDAGYTVIETADGKEAVRVYRERTGDIGLLLFDVIMPGMNGKEAYDEIRGLQPDIRVLFISGYAADIMHQKGIPDSLPDVVYKPFTSDVLLRSVRAALDR